MHWQNGAKRLGRPYEQTENGMSADPGTADRIVDIVEDLMMLRGFNAVSYADVAKRIGIRKASIHYHFPAKADLGEAVIRRYADKMAGVTTPVADFTTAELAGAFERFLTVFVQVADSSAKVCLGGVLGAEYETLPAGMQAQVRRFYEESQNWLAALLERGRADGVFVQAAGADADETARAIFSLLEGALIIGRALGERTQLDAALKTARALAGLPGAS